MQVIDGAHSTGNVAIHTNVAGNTWYTDLAEHTMGKELFDPPISVEELQQKIITCPVSPSFIFFCFPVNSTKKPDFFYSPLAG